MGTGLGILAKVAARVEVSSISGQTIAAAAYPTTPTLADTVEVALGGSDLIPLLSEGLETENSWDHDETIIGGASTIGSDLVGIMPAGPLEVSAHYDGLDALIGCALGFEKPLATDSPDFVGATALTGAGAMTSTQFIATAGVFAAGDVGKSIRVVSSTGQGQVRRITTLTTDKIVVVTPAWDVTPVGMTGEMSRDFTHTFECSNGLATEEWDDFYASWPTGGVYNAADKIVRRLTVGVEKNQTKPWVFRSAMVNSMSISAQAGSGLSFSFDLVPFDLDRDSGTNTASTTWDWDNSSELFEDNERILFSDIDYFRIDAYSTGTALTSADNYGINGFELSINNNLQTDDQDAITGNYRVEPARGGMREITGTITLPRYEADTFVTWAESGTLLMAELSVSGSTIDSLARNMKIYICSLKLEQKSVPIDGASVIKQTFNFRALAPTGAPASFPTANLTAPRSEIFIQTTNQNPFNVFLDQNKEY